jgi:hypothetical protein
LSRIRSLLVVLFPAPSVAVTVIVARTRFPLRSARLVALSAFRPSEIRIVAVWPERSVRLTRLSL